MKLEYRLLPCWPKSQSTSFHFFPLSVLQYKTTNLYLTTLCLVNIKKIRGKDAIFTRVSNTSVLSFTRRLGMLLGFTIGYAIYISCGYPVEPLWPSPPPTNERGEPAVSYRLIE
jgi:hypothetical protein